MKFQKAVNLWAEGIQDKILRGELKLQPGQWVLCGSKRPSRYCGITKTGTFVVAHADGSGKVKNENFKVNLEYWKGRVNHDDV